MRDLAPEHPALIQHLPVVRLPRQAVATLLAQAVADVVARWTEKGWWDKTTGGAAKKAKAIYEESLGRAPIASSRPND
ncbi:MAG: hypothetical protein NNA31_07890 [Nitrospira sp.]|nr:hypothetical protein [Nitrospira sp.]